jgi:N-acetylglucosaminyldiphosphoundecaprenol N-acetyl-beta-D-mannosaminyltransferase
MIFGEINRYILKLKILDIPIYDKNIDNAIVTLLKHFNFKGNRRISLTGAHGIIEAKKNKNFKNILLKFYLNLPDGMPNVWVGRIKGKKHIKRCYGPDFFEAVLKKTSTMEVKHYLCGGKNEVAQKLKIVCHEKFGNNNICGVYCPPFLNVCDYNYLEIAKEINRLRADIVWIGLSTPKQEEFAHLLAEYTNVSYIICVGAAFDFHTNGIKQAPKVLQKMGLEWLFRLLIEPKRLFKRYFEVVPKYIYYNIIEFLNFVFKKREV